MLTPFRLASFALVLPLFGCDTNIADGTGGSHPLPITTSSGTGSGTGGPGSTSSTGTGGSGTGGAGMCMGGGPAIVTQGDNTKILLKGTVLVPSGPIQGEVYIVGNSIACVDVSCEAQATGATVIDTHGIISPGLIDAHNHILFDIFDEDDWSPTMTYTNHNQWPSDAKYGAMVDVKQYLNGEIASSPFDLGCELDKYGEMKGLIAGTTSIQGSPGGAAKTCYRSLARTIDQTASGLPADKMQTATIFPSASAAVGVCNNFAMAKTDAYVVHIGEGVDPVSKAEFTKLGTISTTDNCLYDTKTTLIHATALDDADFTIMGAAGMSIVWSPRSNVFLYGAGTDYTKTTDIQTALSHGINVSIGPDWSIGGSQNILDELRYADEVDNARFGNMLDAKALWEMATSHPAKALGVTAYVGTIEVGKRADLAVFIGDTQKPYDAILAATPREVTAVFVDGRLLYGDAALQAAGPANGVCEAVDICCRSKVACIAETTGTATDKLGQTLAEFTQVLADASTQYDTTHPIQSQWNFAPIAPLVKCN